MEKDTHYIEIMENKKIIAKYNMICPRCNKELTAISIKQLNHNYKMHRIFCLRKLDEVMEK